MPSLLERFDQISYVTNDIDHAVAMFEEQYGVVGWTVNLTEFDAVVRQESGRIRINLGTALIDDIRIEIISPVADLGGLYTDCLKGGATFQLHFHHTGAIVRGPDDAWRERAAELERRGVVHMTGHIGESIRFIYADERPFLGHMVEHFWVAGD
jgi:hypothetical protein